MRQPPLTGRTARRLARHLLAGYQCRFSGRDRGPALLQSSHVEAPKWADRSALQARGHTWVFGALPCHHRVGVTVDPMSDDNEPTADELEQLAQSLAIDGSLGRADTLRVVDVLRALAAERRSS